MGFFSGFDTLEVTLLRELGSGEVSGEERGASPPCCRVELLSEEREERGPPWFRAVQWALGGGVGGENGS